MRGENCLFEACRYYGNKKTLKILIKEGININQIDKNGYNYLFYACTIGYKEIIKLLIEDGIDIQDNIYKSKMIDGEIKRYVKELKIKREVRENYYL